MVISVDTTMSSLDGTPGVRAVEVAQGKPQLQPFHSAQLVPSCIGIRLGSNSQHSSQVSRKA